MYDIFLFADAKILLILKEVSALPSAFAGYRVSELEDTLV
jgi:hypothetical protein